MTHARLTIRGGQTYKIRRSIKGSTLDGEIRGRPFMYSVLETASFPLVWEPIQYDGDWGVAWELNEWSTPNSFRIEMVP